MKAVLRALCVLVLGMSIVLPSIGPASAQAGPRLIPFPTDLRPNDAFYVAGGVFPGKQDLTLFLFCKDPWHSYYGHWYWTLPAAHLSGGTFAGWELHTPTPFTRNSVTCQLVTRAGDNPIGLTAKVTIWPQGTKMPHRTFPVHLRVRSLKGPSRAERIDIISVPDARLTVTAREPGGKMAAQRTIVLPWTGQTSLKLPMRATVVRGERVALVAQLRLGSFAARRYLHFYAYR